MDTTVRGIDMDEANIERVIKEILAIDANDGIIFRYEKIEPIREDDDYNNFRVHFNTCPLMMLFKTSSRLGTICPNENNRLQFNVVLTKCL